MGAPTASPCETYSSHHHAREGLKSQRFLIAIVGGVVDAQIRLDVARGLPRSAEIGVRVTRIAVHAKNEEIVVSAFAHKARARQKRKAPRCDFERDGPSVPRPA